MRPWEDGLESRASRKSSVVVSMKPHRAGEHQPGSCGLRVFWPVEKQAFVPRILSFEICSVCSIYGMVLTSIISFESRSKSVG